MYVKKTEPLSSLKQTSVFVFFLITFAGTAYASKSFVQDKRITMKEAVELVNSSRSEISIEVNDLVLKQLNRYLGTSEGRDFFKKSLARMAIYKPMIERKIILNKLPLELMVVPLVESGYQNLSQDPKYKSWGAGIWMFIESTARTYGLRVDQGIDERLNPNLLTDAGLKYFQANYGLFSDWKLSILAYNMGEKNVLRAMKELNTTDAWVIIRSGRENDRDYLARVIAAIIIYKNQNLLN
jgi:membrane-bound lytic murein transglycosylase D